MTLSGVMPTGEQIGTSLCISIMQSVGARPGALTIRLFTCDLRSEVVTFKGGIFLIQGVLLYPKKVVHNMYQLDVKTKKSCFTPNPQEANFLCISTDTFWSPLWGYALWNVGRRWVG